MNPSLSDDEPDLTMFLQAVQEDNLKMVHEFLRTKSSEITDSAIVIMINRTKSAFMMSELLSCIGPKLYDFFKHEKIGSLLLYALEINKNYDIIATIIQFSKCADIINDSDKTNFHGSPLVYSVKHYLDKNIIELLISHGADVNKCDSEGRSALHYVNDVELIRILRDNKADLNSKDENGLTPLMLAINNIRYVEILMELIVCGADINLRDNKKNSVLMYALKNRYDMDFICHLVSFGANLNVRNKYQFSPLHFALYYGCDKEIISFLCRSGSRYVSNDPSLLNYAFSRCCSEDVIVELIDYGVPLYDYDEYSPLLLAIKRMFSKDTVNKMIDNGANVNYAENTCNKSIFLYALEFDYDEEIIIKLIEKGADFYYKDSFGNGALECSRNEKLNKLFLELGCTPREDAKASSSSCSSLR